MFYRKTILSLNIVAALAIIGAPAAHAEPAADGSATAAAQPSAPATSAPEASGDSGAQSVAQGADGDTAKARNKRGTKPEPTTLEAIQVIGGIAGSQAQDLILKRYAPQTQDSITAVNIGQLPDMTISDALARITGVQIGRSGGEGTTVTIRGLPQIQTTLNGEEFLSAGGVNSIANFIDIPPTLFSGVDVLKSTTASDISGGISGIVNFRTHRPFDFHEGWTVNASATGDWGDRTKHFNKAASGLLSYRTSNWGNLLTLSYSTELINNTSPTSFDQTLGSAQRISEQQAGFNFRGAGPLSASIDPTKRPTDFYYSFDTSTVGNTQTQRKRIGAYDSFQYRFTDALELVGDVMYSHMKSDNFKQALAFQTPFQLQQNPAPNISPEGALISGLQSYAEVTSTAVLNASPTKALNTNLQLNYDNHGFFSGSLRWVHGRTTQQALAVTGDADVNQGNVIPLPDGTSGLDNPNGVPNDIPIYHNFTGQYPAFNIMQNIGDPSKWVLISNFANGSTNTTNLDVFSASGELHFASDLVPAFKFGVRSEKQSLDSFAYTYLTPVNQDGACANPLGPGPRDALYQYLDPRIVNACTGTSPFLLRQITALPQNWWTMVSFSPSQVTSLDGNAFPVIDPKVLKDPVSYLKAIAGGVATGDPARYENPPRTWTVDERVRSAYGQFDFEGQLGSMPWSGNAGMRYVDTTLNVYSSLTSPSHYVGNGGSWDGVLIRQGTQLTSNRYKTWLPSLNFALNTTSDQILRFAWNRAQSRQNLQQLGGGTSVGYLVNGNPPKDPTLPQDAQIFINASSGNPNLLPYRSTNYNLGYEWYFAPRSMVSLGTFVMDVKSFPIAAVVQERLPDADGVVRRSGSVSTYLNGGGAVIRGIEGQFQTQFLQLPGWLSGFGVEVNATHMTSTNTASIGAHDLYNAVVFYQKYKIQARLAYNWQGSSFVSQNTSAGNTLNVMEAPAGYLDASVQYDVTPNVSVLFQATNLTNTFDQQYFGFQSQWLSDNISERRFYLGVRAHF